MILVISGLSDVTAQSNQYLHFDGQDDYTFLENAAQYVNNSNTITMAGWFYTDQLVYGQGMMSIRGGGTGDGQMYLIQLDNGILECRVITTTGLHQVVGPAGTIQAGQWQHIAWVFNESYVQLFINGNSAGVSSASGIFQSSDRPFSVGRSIQAGLNFYYGGRADEVSLWSKALSQTEIQDMMANELVGDEENLEVYYKFNQGSPGGDNSSVTEVLDESGDVNRNSDLMNFSMTGQTSNFNGELEDSFQSINFLAIENKLVSSPDFQLNATSSSGLPVSFEVVSGPATVVGNTVSLTGVSGEVTIMASQEGNSQYDPAADVFVSFQVLDPTEILVETEVLHPLEDQVFAPNLIPLKIAVRADIDYPELFSISEMNVTVDDDDVELTNHGNGFFTGWWTPDSYGSHSLVVNANNNFGETNNTSLTFDLIQNTTSQTVNGTTDVWVSADYPTQTVETDLPSHVGAFDQIMGTLYIDCPSGGCDPWDRVSTVEAQGKDGEWYEIIRYLTPYGVSCQSQIDLTDFGSILQGKTKFRVNLGTQGNGFLYTLQLNYSAGIPDNPYSSIQKLWYQTYQFGDMANLQPTEDFTMTYPENAQTAKIKLVSTGHGWGESNTGNAAEFLDNTHHIWVNGEQTFTQHNWNVCNPNPDGCSPQAGTWYYNRAGWCPGSIAQFFDFEMGDVSSEQQVELDYVFDESYVDYCHPNNPNCVENFNCADCDDGFNPHLIISSYLVTYGDAPLNTLKVSSIQKADVLNMYPNPSTGIFYVDIKASVQADKIAIYDNLGRLVRTKFIDAGSKTSRIDISDQPAGIYLISIMNGSSMLQTKRLVIE